MSITSMSARANMAQKLSIPQLQQAIQDGVIPPYVGVPLLQDKVKQQKEAMSAAVQQKMPSVAQQVMAEAQQAEQGVQSLPTNLPAEMAGGGIVAFAEGGMYDDDEDSYENRMDAAREADLDAAMQEALDAREEMGLMPEQKGASDSYQAVRATPNGGEFEALALEKNKSHGVDERLLKHVMHKETGGMKDREHAVSKAGAQGVMQLMPGTAKDLGVKDPFNASQNIEGGIKYLAQLERKYKDPKLAAMAYNWGPGNVDKWLMAGADTSKLPRETQGYVQGLAKGGEVQHFDGTDGSLVYNPETGMMEEEVKREGFGTKLGRLIGYGEGLNAGENMPGMGKAKEQVAELLAKRNGTPTAPKAEPVKEKTPSANEGLSQDSGLNARIDKMLAGTSANAPVVPPATPPATAMATAPAAPSKFEELFAKREENLAKQKEQDKYMALLSAGLGMMGGTSPFAAANIGAGAQQGVQALLHSNAARTAEENAILSGRLGLEKINAAKEQALQSQALREKIFGAQNARLTEQGKEQAAARTERLSQAQMKEIQDSLENRATFLSKNAMKAAESIFDPVKKQQFLDDLERKISQDKIYRELHKQRWGYYPGNDENLNASQSKGGYDYSKADSILGGK